MTGRIIIVGGEKGGTGKTTIAVNLAGMAAMQHIDALLIDADPNQRSAAKWHAARQELHPEAAPLQCVSATGRHLDTTLSDFARRYQAVIVDTGAQDSVEWRAAASVADLMLIPVQPDSFDFWTLPTAEAVFRRASSFNAKLRCRVILNRIPHQLLDKATAEAKAFIADNVPQLSAEVIPVIGRTAYGNATAEGLAIWEVQRRDWKAATEMQRLYREVFEDAS